VIGDDGLLRQGAMWRLDQPLVDSVRAEYGARLRGGSHQTRSPSAVRSSGARHVQVGYANVDPVFGVLNGDSYGAGNRCSRRDPLRCRWISAPHGSGRSRFSAPITSANDGRVDLGLKWDVLNTLKRVGAAR
jgi:hypothetical protein